MGKLDFILKVNALGTIFINEVFREYAGEGFCLINIDSITGTDILCGVRINTNYPAGSNPQE